MKPMNINDLWVVSVISNPVRYKSRYNLYAGFEERVLSTGANLMTVELAHGGRDFEITNSGHERHLQLRGKDELWHKENLINLGIQNLPESWKYVAWIDADIEFVRKDWAEEIVQQLQHYKMIQVFQDAIDLGPNGEFLQKHNGFAWSYITGQKWGGAGYGYPHWHPGFGWAARRETIDDLGGLLDIAILGSGDHHMACGLVGKILQKAPTNLTDGYKRHLNVWEERCNTHIRGDFGFVAGSILHHWHGKKRDRRYQDRWKILQNHAYDPDYDIVKDWQGVYQFSRAGERMKNDIRAYFRARNEDSIDV